MEPEKEEEEKIEEVPEKEEEEKIEVFTPEVVVNKHFKGQEIISDTIREVNGKFYKHISIGDGSSYDLTDEEYLLEIK